MGRVEVDLEQNIGLDVIGSQGWWVKDSEDSPSDRGDVGGQWDLREMHLSGHIPPPSSTVFSMSTCDFRLSS